MLKRFLLLPIVAVLLLAGGTGAIAQSDLIGIYLTWKGDPTTTMTVNWVNLYEKSPDLVWYREKGAEGWLSKKAKQSKMEPSALQIRRVELTGLKPDTDYEFAIGEKEPADAKGTEKFRTMPAELEKPMRFVTGGDMMHKREWVDAMNKQAGRLDPHFALLGGDLAYANNASARRWIDWLESWTKYARGKGGRLLPMVVAIGNHEVRKGYDGKIPDDASHFYSLFDLPEDRSYYALDFGKYLSLVVLDSGHTHKVAGPQAQWLEGALKARTGQKFLFPAYHYPAYGSAKASKGRLPSEGSRAKEIREQWITHFERYGVTAVFEYDNHTYKRTHPIRNNKRDDKNGIIYLGDGAWGVEARKPVTPEEAWYIAKSEAIRHLYSLTLSPDGNVDVQAIDATGKVFDSVKIASPRTAPVAP